MVSCAHCTELAHHDDPVIRVLFLTTGRKGSVEEEAKRVFNGQKALDYDRSISPSTGSGGLLSQTLFTSCIPKQATWGWKFSVYVLKLEIWDVDELVHTNQN